MTTRKNLRSFRLSAQAERQLAELSEALGTSLTETLTVAIDHLWQDMLLPDIVTKLEEAVAAAERAEARAAEIEREFMEYKTGYAREVVHANLAHQIDLAAEAYFAKHPDKRPK